MAFNLLSDPFFPVVTASGKRHFIPFAGLFKDDDDPPVDFDWPRADLNIAAFEFCIGVLTVALQFEIDDWGEVWADGLAPADVKAALAPLCPAFNLDGDGPRFMQAFEKFEKNEASPVEALFIDTPGANAQKKNTDLLTHSGRFGELGLPAAGIALYALQQFAPSGGAGNRTSMRGGGPLTVLLTLHKEEAPVPLWRQIMVNLAPIEAVDRVDAVLTPRIFPWLAPSLVSDKAHGERVLHALDAAVHPWQAGFGMPRRIRLVEAAGEGLCALTGEKGRVMSGFSQVPWGANYGLWEHPLTPYRQQKEGSYPYSVKPKSGRFGYRDWVGLVYQGSGGNLAQTSANVTALANRRGRIRRQGYTMGLRVAGWVMNNMEAITYLHCEQPLYLARDDESHLVLADLAGSMVSAGEIAHEIIRSAVRRANFSQGAPVDTSTGAFVEVRTTFYTDTERAFHRILSDAAYGEAVDVEGALKEWHRELRSVATLLFQRFAKDPSLSQREAERFADAYRELVYAFAGYGASGTKLFQALKKPVPKSKQKTKEKETRNG